MIVPQTQALQVGYQIRVRRGEVAAQVRLGEKVFVGRLDGLADADDIGDGRRGRDGHCIGVAQAVLANGIADGRPIEPGGAVHVETTAAFAGEEFNGVNRHQPLFPFRALERGIRAALPGEFG